ncbi:hypothetical protein QDR37_12345 [Amnibacterium sp. CER49]|uniref:hypothetical protein n=1 Tax=Amnibacterium sp. CER49 TaxID=3039161 RepID=UPI0024488DFB|nr:hypothetical protein [Amnibacterium sp. CER49]MDH2444736.1 hypothetical protein [Amnibacterium sp. CER49]
MVKKSKNKADDTARGAKRGKGAAKRGAAASAGDALRDAVALLTVPTPGGGGARAKKDRGKKDAGKKGKKARKAEAKDRKRQAKAEKAARKAQKAEARQGRRSQQAGGKPAGDAARPQPDQVEVLKLALRDTEAKLVDAEHRLRQVQQQLDDERRALALAAEERAAEQRVDAAVEATVADALLGAELAAAAAPQETVADVARDVAERLDDATAQAEVADPEAPPVEAAIDAAAVFTRDEPALPATPSPAGGGTVDAAAGDRAYTPPLPHAPQDGRPNDSWTLVHLRQEAKRRGLQGVSNLPKHALVERLNE